MVEDTYEASKRQDYDKQILSYLDIQDRLSMCSVYEDYRERERIEVSKPFFVCCNVTKLMAIENEHSHLENASAPVSTEQLPTHKGGTIHVPPLPLKIPPPPPPSAPPPKQH